MSVEPGTELQLADWRRQVSDLYAEVRRLAVGDPLAALTIWREERERLYRDHPLSPVPAAERTNFSAKHFEYDPTLRFEVIMQPAGAAATRGEVPTAGAAAMPRTPRATPASSPLGTPPPLAAPLGWPLAAPNAAPNAALNAATPPGTMTLGAPPSLPNSGTDVLSFRRIGSVEIPFPGHGRRVLSIFWMEAYAGGLFLPFRDATSGAATYAAGRYLLDTAKSADLGGDPARGSLILDFNFAYQPSCAFDPRWACPLAPSENRLDLAVRAGERIA